MGASCSIPLSCNKVDILSKYEFGRQIGRGHFGIVRICYDLVTNMKYAVKIIDKEKLADYNRLQLEVTILQRLGKHPGICYLNEVFEDKTSIYLIMEYCEGGDLLKHVIEQGKLTQERTTTLLRQVGEALLFLHSKKIIHRDIKPENVMLTDTSPDSTVKLIDFGLAAIVGDTDMTATTCGTWAYYAPEMVHQKPYDYKVDIWALGVLMFILLSGYHPFDIDGDSNKATVLARIIKCEFNFNDPVWNDVDPHACDTIKKLLKINPNERLTLEQFLSMDYIANGPTKMEYIQDITKKYNKIKKHRDVVESTANFKNQLNRTLKVAYREFIRFNCNNDYTLLSNNENCLLPSFSRSASAKFPPQLLKFAHITKLSLLPLPVPPKLPVVGSEELPGWLLSLPSSDVGLIQETIDNWLEMEKEIMFEGNKNVSKLNRTYTSGFALAGTPSSKPLRPEDNPMKTLPASVFNKKYDAAGAIPSTVIPPTEIELQSVEVNINDRPAVKRKSVQIAFDEKSPNNVAKNDISSNLGTKVENKQTIIVPIIDKSRFPTNACPISPFNSHKLPAISDITSISSVTSNYSDKSAKDKSISNGRSPKTKNHSRKISSPLPVATVVQLRNTSRSIESAIDKARTSRSPSITPRRINNANSHSSLNINLSPRSISTKSPETINIYTTPRRSSNVNASIFEPIKPFNSATVL